MQLKERCDWIKSKVTMRQLFDEFGVHYQATNMPHQVRCPFHDDLHASARFFPLQNDGSGSFFCWACDMGGDVIWFYQQWYQEESLIKALKQIESQFGLEMTEEDRLSDFYKARAKFDKEPDDATRIEALLKLTEVNLAGRLRTDDPEPLRPNIRADTFELHQRIWSGWDTVTELARKQSYKGAVALVEGFDETVRSRLDGRSKGMET